MLQYLVLNEEGDKVKTGSTIKDFRGQEAIFIQVTRGVEYNGTAKVLVHAPGALTGREYYATVFDLKVQTKCGVPNCGSVDHSTRDHNAEERH